MDLLIPVKMVLALLVANGTLEAETAKALIGRAEECSLRGVPVMNDFDAFVELLAKED